MVSELVAVLLAAACSEVDRRTTISNRVNGRPGTIPNELPLLGMVLGLAINGWLGIAGAAACMLVAFPLGWTGIMGGGDFKLFAALGALLGPYGLLVEAVTGAIVPLAPRRIRQPLGFFVLVATVIVVAFKVVLECA